MERFLTQFLDSMVERVDDDPSEMERWMDYVETFCDVNLTSASIKRPTEGLPVILVRNLRKQKRLWKGKLENKRHLLERSFFSLSPQGNSSDPGSSHKKRKSPNADSVDVPEKDSTAPTTCTESSDSQGSEIDTKSKRWKQPLNDSETEECLQLAKDSMVIHDNTLFRFKVNSYKMMFVHSLGCYMFRQKSFGRAQKAHRRISRKMDSRFRAWHKIWLDKYVTPCMMESC